MSEILIANARDLTSRTRRAGHYVAMGQAVGAILSLLSMAALARLLTPEDFGLVAMATVVTSFVMIFADAGLSAAVVLHEDLDQRQVSNLFWINAALGGILFAAIALSAPLVAGFYGRPEVGPICLGCACSFLPMSLGIQHSALLRRRLEFGRMSLVGQGSVAGGLVVAISAAGLGWGPWSLVAQLNAMAVLRTVFFWMACPWRPSLPTLGAGSRGLVRFGSISLADELLRYAGRNLDVAAIGRVIGADALGIYTRSQTLFAQVPTQLSGPFNSIAGPALARVQADPSRFRSAYRAGLLMISAVCLPAVAAMFVLAEPLIEFLMGPQWLTCIPVFRWLIADTLASALGGCAVGWLFIYQRRIKLQLVGTMISTLSRAIAVAAYVRFGLEPCAAAVSVTTLVATFGALLLALRGNPVRLRDVVQVLALPLIGSTFAGAILGWALVSFPAEWASGIRLLAGACFFGVAYAIPWLALPVGRRCLAQILRTAVEPATAFRLSSKVSPRLGFRLRSWLETGASDGSV